MISDFDKKTIDCYTEEEMKAMVLHQEELFDNAQFPNLPLLYHQGHKTFIVDYIDDRDKTFLKPFERKKLLGRCYDKKYEMTNLEISDIMQARQNLWRNIRIPAYLSGVVSMAQYYDEEYRKNIFIIGEIHSRADAYVENSDIMRTDKFLIKWITTIPILVDFFLETPLFEDSLTTPSAQGFIASQTNSSVTTLQYLFLAFENCFVHNKKCKEIGRFHSIDLRQNFLSSIEVFSRNKGLKFSRIIFVYYSKYFYGDIQEEELTAFRRVFEIIIKDPQGNITDKSISSGLSIVFDSMWEISKAQKQLNNISLEARRIEIYDYFMRMKMFYIAHVIEIYHKYERQGNRELYNGYRYEIYLLLFLMGFISIPMDCYTIARMYKDSIPSSYIIVYCGNDHAKNYNNFLKRHCHVIASVSGKESDGIVDISDFKFNGF